MTTQPWDWPGARWWKFDLHAHTPASYDFKDGRDDNGENWRQWIESVRDAGVQAIALTDHNSAEGIEPIKNAASETKGDPIVFPAVELTAIDGSHLLIVMDPCADREHINDLLTRAKIGVDERGSQTARAKLSVEQILEIFQDKAVVIGAHANGPSGIFKHEGEQLLGELRNVGLAAVEIDPNYSFDEAWLDGSKPQVGRIIPQLWSSDAHRFSELGRRFTWIKMTQPNLEGLRLALSDGSASLKAAKSSNPGDPNVDRANLVIESICVKNAKLIGRPKPTVIRLNPWMNAIIGGRATGKSTFVDFCRKVLGREDELEGADSPDEGSLRHLFDRRMQVPESRNHDGLLTNETTIRITYIKDGESFLLSWMPTSKSTSISRIVDGALHEEEGDVSERFPVRIYSQKQLFSLAQDPDALLTIIDDDSDVRGRELSRRMEQIETQYLAECAEARATLAQASELPALNASLNDVTRKLDVLQEGQHTVALDRYRTNRDLDAAWNTTLNSADEALESVKVTINGIPTAKMDIVPDTQDNESQTALRRSHQSLQDAMQAFQRDVLERIASAKLQITDIRSSSDANEWQTAVQDALAEYNQVVGDLQEEGISDPNQYSELLDQAGRLRSEIESLKGLMSRAQEMSSAASETLRAYRKVRNELSNRRRAFASQMSSPNLQVEIVPYAGHSSLADDLIGILGIDRFEDDRKAIANSIHPSNGVWEWKALDDLVSRLRQFQAGEIESWNSRDRRFDAALTRISPESIDRMALYLPDDSVRVKFNDGRSGSSWRSLSQGSPGQQTATLLAFVLGFGNEPIILDQPEDDLDNTLIYELLVTRLREQKINRQIIVITHNPNIVVHGDTEFVVSLNIRGSQTVVERQGGLQERGVRDEICRVMEGGREAFETRYRRIMPPSGS